MTPHRDPLSECYHADSIPASAAKSHRSWTCHTCDPRILGVGTSVSAPKIQVPTKKKTHAGDRN